MRNLKQGFLFVLLTLTLFFLTGCDNFSFTFSPPPKPAGTVVAKVGDSYYITLDELNAELDQLNAMAAYYNPGSEPKKFTKEEKIEILKNELIPRYLFYKMAKAKGMDKDPKISAALLNAQIKVLDEQLLKKETEGLTATNQEIENFYNTYKDQFQQDEERRIREIVVATEDEAKEIMIELLKGTDFAALAQQKSIAKSAAQGGDLGFIRKSSKGAGFKKFDEVAFSPSMESGEMSPVFKDKDGYYIVRVESIKGGQTQPLSEVADQVKNAVIYVKQQQKLQEIKDGLSKKAKYELYQEQVK